MTRGFNSSIQNKNILWFNGMRTAGSSVSMAQMSQYLRSLVLHENHSRSKLEHRSATGQQSYAAVALRHGPARMPMRRARKPVERQKMAKRSKVRPTPSGAARKPAERGARPGFVHSSVYLPEQVYEALREAAFL